MKSIKNTSRETPRVRSSLAVRSREGQGGYVLLMVFIFLLVLGMVVGYLTVSTLTTEKEVGVTSDQNLAMQNARLALRDAQLDILGRLHNNAYAMSPDGKQLNTGATSAKGRRPNYSRPSFCAPNYWTSWSSPLKLWDFKNGDAEGACTPLMGASGKPATLMGSDCGIDATKACTVGDVVTSRVISDGDYKGMYIPGKGVLNGCDGQSPWLLADWGKGFGQVAPGCNNRVVPSVEYGEYTGAGFDTSSGVPRPRYIIEILTPDTTGLNTVDASTQGTNVTKDKVLFRITAVGYGASVAQTNAERRMHVMVQEVVSP